MEIYPSNIEVKMKLFYDNLSEKDKRHYAAVEVLSHLLSKGEIGFKVPLKKDL